MWVRQAGPNKPYKCPGHLKLNTTGASRAIGKTNPLANPMNREAKTAIKSSSCSLLCDILVSTNKYITQLWLWILPRNGLCNYLQFLPLFYWVRTYYARNNSVVAYLFIWLSQLDAGMAPGLDTFQRQLDIYGEQSIKITSQDRYKQPRSKPSLNARCYKIFLSCGLLETSGGPLWDTGHWIWWAFGLMQLGSSYIFRLFANTRDGSYGLC